jgi:hypothetical protein
MKTTTSESGVTRWALDSARMDVRHYPLSGGAVIGVLPSYDDDGCERALSPGATIELIAALSAALLAGETA